MRISTWRMLSSVLSTLASAVFCGLTDQRTTCTMARLKAELGDRLADAVLLAVTGRGCDYPRHQRDTVWRWINVIAADTSTVVR